MKNFKLFLYLLALASMLLLQKQQVQAGEVYYYNFEEKIFLTERCDGIFLKTDLEKVNKEDLENLIQNVSANLRFVDVEPDDDLLFVQLWSKDGEDIDPSVLDELKASDMIVSASFLLEYEHKLSGLSDEFFVKTKASTSYDQLQQLAQQNNCVIVRENWPLNNEYFLSVSKASGFNSLQMANLFYETGLFEYATPNFVILNAFDGLPGISSSSVELFQNYPNPFREETTIHYALPAGIGRAEIQLFDLSGRLLKRYAVNSSKPTVIKSSELKAGVYFYSLIIAGKTVDTKRMIIMQ